MPYRKIPFVNQEFYHIFNRSVASQPIFIHKHDYSRMLDLVNYYVYKKPPLRYSHFKRLNQTQRDFLYQSHPAFSNPLVKIIAYCIMPNHFHFLLQQVLDNGISDFMRNIEHSYSKYFDTKYKRTGALIQSMFHAVHIETTEHLIHVSRYIHLNPVTAYLVKPENISNYVWSSFPDYIFEQQSIVDTSPVLSSFPSRASYQEFVLDQVEYQRTLAAINHLTLE